MYWAAVTFERGANVSSKTNLKFSHLVLDTVFPVVGCREFIPDNHEDQWMCGTNFLPDDHGDATSHAAAQADHTAHTGGGRMGEILAEVSN